MSSTTTDRRFGVNTGQAVKVPCIATTTANISLTGEQTIDGIACVSGDRVLVKNQTTASENGIYYVNTSSWTRSPDFDDINDVVEGTVIPVNRGTNNSDTAWRITNTGTITPGTTSLTFENAAFSASSSVSFLQYGTGAVSRTVQSKLRELVSVTDFGADITGTASSLTAFQNAVDSTPNSGIQLIFVPRGTYLGDMTTLSYGSRTLVIFVEDSGTVTYSTAAPANRQTSVANGALKVAVQTNTTATPMAIRGEVTINAGAGSGLPWAILGVASSYTTDSAKHGVGIYGQAVGYAGSSNTMWGGVFEAANARQDNADYGSTYGTQPDGLFNGLNGIEVDSVNNDPYDDSTTRRMGIQLVAYGGGESTNGFEIHAAADTGAHTHSGTAQAGAAGTITLAADASASANYYSSPRQCIVAIVSGTGSGQQRKITAYNGGTKVATTDSNWSTIPDATSAYVVFDIYNTGLWRRGIKIFSGALNITSGVGVDCASDCGSGFIVSGNTSIEDFGVRRTTANAAKIEIHVGSQTGAIFTQNTHAGDSAGATADVNYMTQQIGITSNATGSHSGYIRWMPTIGGSVAGAQYAFKIGNGVVLGDAGTLNEQGISTFNLLGGYYHTNNKVLGARSTGWTAATGTATRTTFDTATVTLPVLAEHVKALIDDFITHGTIGA